MATYDISLKSKTVHMNLNPIRMAENVCEELISQKVYAVVISSPMKGELSPAAVSYTCGFYSIPVIGISSRHSSLSDKNLHKTFLRTVPPYSHQADVWIKLLRHLGYSSIVFIHSSDNDGRATLGRFHNVAAREKNVVHIEHVIEFESDTTDLAAELRNASRRHCRVYVLYADTNEATKIFDVVKKLEMTTAGYVWLVSEQALKAPNCPDGVLGLDLVNAVDERAHIRDSVNLIAIALKKLQRDASVSAPRLNCSSLEHNWDAGLKLVSILKEQILMSGETGHVKFDDKGDRLNSDYVIFNIQRERESHLVKVGEYAYNEWKNEMELNINLEYVLWPGGSKEKPLGFVIPKHLRVATLAERPFVWTRQLNGMGECYANETLCPWYNRSSKSDEVYCCFGYCMDLLKVLSSKLNFSYDLYLVEDAQYGNLEPSKEEGRRVWTGLIGDLVRKRADMVVAPLTITPERSLEVDFTKPFKYQGITILAKKQDKSSTLASFLQPFQKSLWIVVVFSVHVVALGLYLLDRFSPFGNYRVAPSERDEDGLNLSSALWFAWGVLLNSGIAEGTPRSFSGRVLGMVWAGFAMIVVASYTANLAAFLVLEKPESSLSGINDPRLRNPSENFTYATVRGSAVDTYFKRQVELQNMYRIMEGKNFDTVDHGIDALMNGNIDAFIWDSSRLEYEAARHCDLVTAGEQFGRSGYGVALQRNSFWVDKVTLALLEMHESGHMEQLDSRWIHNGGRRCESKLERTPATLGLTNMAGVFILVGAGIFGGLVLIVIEVYYKRYKAKQKRRMEVASKAAAKWRGVVERRRTVRRGSHHRIMLPSNIQQAPLPATGSLKSVKKDGTVISQQGQVQGRLIRLKSASSSSCKSNSIVDTTEMDLPPPPPPPPLRTTAPLPPARAAAPPMRMNASTRYLLGAQENKPISFDINV
ncbi:glutamate [NMDA] receptor subunit 1 [Galendromus occidentalis]|uniref:Glutamate [NMDA] receptor subunit 1 n=1 Tax=Galendromus occidentalis TaxID=34638 RepID=A0AAJ7SF32_9ACAR|nr:glutamate [NMDA] receptor subunit 1 [Galendromus occidentalis]